MRIAAVLATATLSSVTRAADDGVIELRYQMTAPGQDASLERVLVSAVWLRIDAGAQDSGGGFLLYDRAANVLYNVIPDQRRILELRAPRAVAAPAALGLEVRRRALAQAPPVGGHAVHEVQLMAQGELCAGATVAPGLLDDARAALGAYRTLLAASNQSTLDNTPRELHSPCFLADVYAGDFLYRHGLPVEDWRADGTRRRLLGFDAAATVPAATWQLPDYARLRIGGG